MHRFVSSLWLFFPVVIFSQVSEKPDVFLLSKAALIAVRAAYQKDSAHPSPVLAAFLKEARTALGIKPVTVVDKEHLPPSGDKHDYYSIAPYWWPDSTKKGGVPYIRRDGEVNPERYTVGDRERIRTLNSSVYTLSLASFITGEKKFAAHAVKFLRTWFLDPDTRMNPHLTYAQAVKGRNEGRGTGIIDAHDFVRLIDGIKLLEGSGEWTQDDAQRLRRWFEEYRKWLTESNSGKEEANAKNNHGSTYDVQSVCIALLIGKDESARQVLRDAGARRIAVQIEPDGSQPLELVRTKAYNYSLLNLEALVDLATLGERLEVDLWSYEAPNGASIRKAIDFLIPYSLGKKEWTWKQIIPFEYERMIPILQMAAQRYFEPSYAAAADTLKKRLGTSSRQNLLLPPE